MITLVEATNLPPADLSLTSASVAENRVAGTLVGNLLATDPDDSNGTGVYTHILVDGNGSTDNASFSVEANGTLKTAVSFDYETKNTYSIRLSVADESNATYEEVFVITVNDMDDTVPVLTLLGNATWMDVVDGNGSADVSGVVDVNLPGLYTLTYSKSDAAGNSATQLTRTVTVVDSTAPVINLNGSSTVTHEAGTSYTDAGAVWTDTLDGNGSAEANGTVNVNLPGTYSLSYFRNDAADNVAIQVQRSVVVSDTTPPVITLNGEANVTVEAGTNFADLGASWTDALDGNGSLQADGGVDMMVPGTYALSYGRTDNSGNTAQLVSRSVTVFNRAPSGISLSGLAVEESFPTGTTVGYLSVPDDPDSNVTKIFTFSLVDGVGSSGNANFQVDGNGTLKTGETLDFESESSYSINVRVVDQFGDLVEQSFTITVTDAFVPIVDTKAYAVPSGTPEISGTVVDVGHSGGVLEVGFVVGPEPDPELNQPGVKKFTATLQGESFSSVASGLEVDKEYYYRAYAENAEGSSYGAQERFTFTSGASPGPSWANAVASTETSDWSISPWLGSFYYYESGWLLHESLGWLFSAGDGTSDVWLWQENLGWFWTGEGVFPYLFENSSGDWHYFMGDVGGRVFLYRYPDGAWIDVEEGKGQD